MKSEPSIPTAPGRLVRVLVSLALTALASGGLASRGFAADYTVTTTGNMIVVTDVSGNGDTLDVSEPSPGNIQFAAAGRTFSVNGGGSIAGNSGVLSRSGVTQITVNAGAGADTIGVGAFTGTLPSLTLNGGAGDDTVHFNGNITFAVNASLDVDLQNDGATPGVDAVNVAGNVLASGTGTITVKCSRNVGVNGGASLQTVNGNLTVEANQQVVPSTGDFAGIYVDGALRCTGTGQISVKGRGGNGAGGGQLGVLVVGAGEVVGGTSGAVTILGTGGASTNWINRGVTIYGGGRVSSLGGPVQVTGVGGSLGSDYGIGVALLYGGVISAGGTGSVTVDGTGAGFGGANQGIEMGVGGSAITSSGGSITVTGTAGPGDSFGITAADSVGFTNLAASGSITLIADSILLENNVGVVASGAGGSVTLKPESNGTLINLGGADVTGTLGLTDEELDFITAGSLVIGGTNAGSITVNAPISPANAAALSLISGSTISDGYSAGTDVIVASLTTRGNLAPGASPGVFSVTGNETLAANSTFTVEIGGTTAGTQFDQLSAFGSVTIGANVTLNLLAFGVFMPSGGQTFTIISRSGGSGTFAGLPQGATVQNFLGSGQNAIISYTGGTGDDVVLTALGPDIVVEQPAGVALEDRMTLDQYAATVIDFSSAYGGPVGHWGANQVLGVPDTFDYGDIPTAWAPETDNGSLEFITVGFTTPVYATGATVRETSGNGFVYQIDVLDTNDVLHTVWTGTDPSLPGSPVNFQTNWPSTPYLVKGLKVYVDTDHAPGEWEEIDAIQLHGVASRLVNFGAVNLGGSSNLTFTIRNTGNANLTGLGITIDGANAGDFAVTASPTAPVSGPSGSTTFTVRFTPAAGGARSAALHIASNDGDENPFDIVLAGRGPVPPAILTQPAGTNAPPGADVTLCVAASGTPLFYQWRRNGVNIPGATLSCLTIAGAQAQDGGTYEVVVANPFGTVVSDPATVVITVPILPPGDNLANRVPLPGTNGTVRASNVNATREPGEPMHVGKPGGASVWYSFSSAQAGIMTIDTAGSTIDTLLAVYTGTTIPALVEVAGDEESGGALTSEVRFNVEPSVAYDIVVDGHGAAMGDFVLSWAFTPTPEKYPVFVVQPQSITVPSGANHTFTAVVSGTGLAYQWFFNGSPVPGATTNSLTRTNIQESALGTYVLRVTQGVRSLDSRPASLQINLTGPGTQPVQAKDKFLDADVLSNPIILGESPGSFAPASVVRGYTGTQVFNTFGAVSASGEPPICGVPGGASIWLKLVAEQSGDLHLNTDGSSFNTLMEVYERIVGVANLHFLGCDDTNGLDRLDSALVVPVVGGRTNFIVIDGVNGATGVLKFNYNLVVPSALTALGRNGSGQFQFLVTGKPGMVFRVLATADLRTWTTLFTGTNAVGSYVYTDTNSPTPGNRLYRLQMLP